MPYDYSILDLHQWACKNETVDANGIPRAPQVQFFHNSGPHPGPSLCLFFARLNCTICTEILCCRLCTMLPFQCNDL